MVLYKQHRHVELVTDALDKSAQSLQLLVAEAASGLIEQDQAWTGDQRARQVYLLLDAERQRTRRKVSHRTEIKEVDKIHGAAFQPSVGPRRL